MTDPPAWLALVDCPPFWGSKPKDQADGLRIGQLASGFTAETRMLRMESITPFTDLEEISRPLTNFRVRESLMTRSMGTDVSSTMSMSENRQRPGDFLQISERALIAKLTYVFDF